MKNFSYYSAIALSALLLGACGGANSVVAPSSIQMHDGSKTASAATSQTAGAKKAAWNALSDADKAAKKANMQARKAAWDALSDDEKAAKRTAKKAGWPVGRRVRTGVPVSLTVARAPPLRSGAHYKLLVLNKSMHFLTVFLIPILSNVNVIIDLILPLNIIVFILAYSDDNCFFSIEPIVVCL